MWVRHPEQPHADDKSTRQIHPKPHQHPTPQIQKKTTPPYSNIVTPLGQVKSCGTIRQMYAILTALCYLLAAGLLADDLHKSRPPRTRVRVLALAALVLHLYELSRLGMHMGDINATLYNVFSASAWMIAAVLVGMSFRRNVLAPAVIVFPGVVLWVLAAAFCPMEPAPLHGHGPMLTLHILSSLLAWGVLATAAMHAVALTFQERLLRRHQQRSWMRALPPLTASENLLFKMLTSGWALLTLSLLTGAFFVHDLLTQHLLHKTVLSVLAWLVFGILLLGRWRRGWRGRQALYLTLAGTIFLILAFFGSKLVLEILLDRSWQL